MAAASDIYRNLNLFGDVFEKVRTDYVEKPDDQKMVEAAINGMLTSLDPHSSYMDAKSFRDMQVQTRGDFGGLGIEVTQEDGLVKVVTPIDDTPASRAGILSGDLITAIDGENVQGLTLNQAVDKMRGDVNTTVKLTDPARPEEGKARHQAHPRGHPDQVGARRMTKATTSAISASPSSTSRPSTALKDAMPKFQKEIPGRQVQGLCARPAQQSGRPARPVGRGGQRLHRPRRDRLDARPQRRRDPALQRASVAISPRASRWSC